MGSACGLRFIGPKPPLGVWPGVRPGVRSAGEALMTEVAEGTVRGVKLDKTMVMRGLGVK